MSAYRLLKNDMFITNQCNILYRIDEAIDNVINNNTSYMVGEDISGCLEWLVVNHPEMLEESLKDWLKAGVLGATMAASSLTGVTNAAPVGQQQSVQQSVTDNIQAKRREIVQLQSDNSNFKKIWSQPDAEGKVSFTKKKENECINTVLSLKTVEQHDQFLDVIKHHMDEIMRVQSYKTSSKYDKQRIIKSYDYQLLSYYYKLTIASKYAMEMSK